MKSSYNPGMNIAFDHIKPWWYKVGRGVCVVTCVPLISIQETWHNSPTWHGLGHNVVINQL